MKTDDDHEAPTAQQDAKWIYNMTNHVRKLGLLVY